jgi:hypothetical protein
LGDILKANDGLNINKRVVVVWILNAPPQKAHMLKAWSPAVALPEGDEIFRRWGLLEGS